MIDTGLAAGRMDGMVRLSTRDTPGHVHQALRYRIAAAADVLRRLNVGGSYAIDTLADYFERLGHDRLPSAYILCDQVAQEVQEEHWDDDPDAGISPYPCLPDAHGPGCIVVGWGRTQIVIHYVPPCYVQFGPPPRTATEVEISVDVSELPQEERLSHPRVEALRQCAAELPYLDAVALF